MTIIQLFELYIQYTTYGFPNIRLITLLMYVLIFILLLVGKKQFILEDSGKNKGKTFVIFFTILLISINALYFGYVYYKANHPDYLYQETSKKAGFHIYVPSYIPEDYKQVSIFEYEQDFKYTKNPVVKFGYALPYEKQSGTVNSFFVIYESKINKENNPQALAELVSSINPETEISQIILPNKKDRPAILQTFPGSPNGKKIYMITEDNLLIVINTTSLSTTELIKVADSLK